MGAGTVHLYVTGLDDLGDGLVGDIARDVLAVEVPTSPPPDGVVGAGSEVERGDGPPARVWVTKA